MTLLQSHQCTVSCRGGRIRPPRGAKATRAVRIYLLHCYHHSYLIALCATPDECVGGYTILGGPQSFASEFMSITKR